MTNASVDILLPTCNRLESLIMTLGGVAAQTLSNLRVFVADQSDDPVGSHPVVLALRRVIEARGEAVEWHDRPMVHGIAEQRDFLLRQATAEAVLYLDDDVLMEALILRHLELRRAATTALAQISATALADDDADISDEAWRELWRLDGSSTRSITRT